MLQVKMVMEVVDHYLKQELFPQDGIFGDRNTLTPVTPDTKRTGLVNGEYLVVELYLAPEEFIGEIRERHHVRILEISSSELQMEQKYLILQKLQEDINLDITLFKHHLVV